MCKSLLHVAGISIAGLVAACQSTSLTPQATPASQSTTNGQETEAALSVGQPQACSVQVAGGPPPKPNKAADFGQGAATGVGRGVQRTAITQVGARIGGQFGAIVGNSIARSQIRDVQDLHGTWTITDGSPNCGCTIEIKTGITLNGGKSNAGKLTPKGCNGPLLQQVARWNLGYSFTGYGADFNLLKSDGRTSIANMKRDGINYFSGTLSDGTAVTMWR